MGLEGGENPVCFFLEIGGRWPNWTGDEHGCFTLTPWLGQRRHDSKPAKSSSLASYTCGGGAGLLRPVIASKNEMMCSHHSNSGAGR